MHFRLVSVTFPNSNRLSVDPTSFSGRYDVRGKASNDGTTRFFVVGDWGGLPFLPYETPSEVAVAEAMGKLGTKLNTSFQLALGDNFYFDGVKSPTDSRFQVRFFTLSFGNPEKSTSVSY